MTEKEQDENPVLISIADRARNILEKFKNSQITSRERAEILQKLSKLSEEAIDSKREREKLGIDNETFLIYWLLKKVDLTSPKELAEEIDNSFKKFENFNDSAEEIRQLKREIYMILVPLMKTDAMVELVDDILKLMRKVYENR